MLRPKTEPCDLHIHSVFSDSDLTVEDIFRQAKEKNLRCIAISDHDNVDAVPQALKLSKVSSVEYIKAIELSSEHEGLEIHILGYFIDEENKCLKEALSTARQSRIKRFALMIDKLNALGISIDKEKMMQKTTSVIPTRLHLGVHLVEKGVVKTAQDAFRKYLSAGKPAYVSRFKFTPKEAVDIIKKSGGLAFLAHPYLFGDPEMIERMVVSAGIDGLELIYPNVSEEKRSLYTRIAEKHGLLKCGGSDAHGTYKRYTSIGTTVAPYEWVELMKKRINSV